MAIASYEYVARDVDEVKDMASRSGRILLTLLEEMRVINSNHPVAQFLYEEGAQFICDVLDGRHPLPSSVVIRHRYSDAPESMEPYPLLDKALNIFSLSIHTVQPSVLPQWLEQLESDFAEREVGAGRRQRH